MYICVGIAEALSQYMIMISEGSRDTEDWSNDAEHSNNLHFTIYSHRKELFYIVIFYCTK